MCCKLLQISEKLLKINPNGAAWVLEAAVRAISVLLSRGCGRSLIVQHSVIMES